MNTERYPWLDDLGSEEARIHIKAARSKYQQTGAVTFPEFLRRDALSRCVDEVRSKEDGAFTTDGTHTPHLLPPDPAFPPGSVRNLEMRTQVASLAYDELPDGSVLSALYRDPILRRLIAAVTGKDALYLSADPLGCCSVNVFRPGYHHSFHFDESEFSTTLMLQESEEGGTGLFQYTPPLREEGGREDLALEAVAAVIDEHGDYSVELEEMKSQPIVVAPELRTLEFVSGTLSVFSGSRSLHRVTEVKGRKSRLVAVLTFASEPGFKNSKEVQELFWGRSA